MTETREPEIGRPMRKVLFFAKSMSTSGTTRAIAEGLRGEGLKVKWINCATWRRWLGEERAKVWLRRLARRFEPDLVFSFFCDVPSDLLAELDPHCRTVIWNEDWSHDNDERLAGWLEHCDLLCLSNKGQVETFRRLGARRVEFVMSGFSPGVHRPAPANGSPKYDVAYIGSPGYNGVRAHMVLKAAEKREVHVFGRGWDDWQNWSPNLTIHGPVGPAKFARVCAEAKVMLGMNAINTLPLYFSNRTWMTLGCRGFHLTHYVPNLEEVFEDGVHLAWFQSFDEMLEKLDLYLHDRERRERVAEDGFRYAREHHTYGHRMAQVREFLEETEAARCKGGNGVHHTGAPLIPSPAIGLERSAAIVTRRQRAE